MGVLRLYYVTINYSVSELRGVLKHPKHPLAMPLLQLKMMNDSGHICMLPNSAFSEAVLEPVLACATFSHQDVSVMMMTITGHILTYGI